MRLQYTDRKYCAQATKQFPEMGKHPTNTHCCRTTNHFAVFNELRIHKIITLILYLNRKCIHNLYLLLEVHINQTSISGQTDCSKDNY